LVALQQACLLPPVLLQQARRPFYLVNASFSGSIFI
jgi:hypothetical protein